MSTVLYDTLKEIQEKNVQPFPRWRVLAVRALWWLALTAVSALGVLAAAATVFQIEAAGWPFLARANNWFSLLIWSVPYWWLVIITITALLAYFAIRHLPRGYRMRVPLVIAGFFLGIGLCGWILHELYWSGEIIDAWGQRILPFQAAMQAHHRQMWVQPQSGILAGEVIGREPNRMFLRDFSGTDWEIIVPASTTLPALTPQQRVRIFGDPLPAAGSALRKFRMEGMALWTNRGMVHMPGHERMMVPGAY